jgi:hypothetical protein
LSARRNAQMSIKMKFWCESPDKAARLCKEMFPEEVRRTVSQADAVCENRFLFSDHWEMERTHEAVLFPGKIDWSYIPADDSEWLYAMNRHTSFLNLSKAWLYTGKERFAGKAVALMSDWIDRVKLTEESKGNTWRSLEAGLRCENWIRSIQMLGNSGMLTESIMDKVKESLGEHGEYLQRTSADFHKLSNWGVLQDHGLFLVGLYLGRKDYVQLAAERLDKEIQMQIIQDGTHWEQSPMYHCEVLHSVLDTICIARQNDISLPERLIANGHKMCKALSAWIKPDGKLFCQSDSDDTEARDLLMQGALLFADGRLKAAARGRLFEENVWDFGEEVLDLHGKLQEIYPETASTVLPDSGNYILRGNNTEAAAYLHMHCGCLGSGHGHGDLLHIDAGMYGEDILIDSGRYTYVDTELRRRLKEPSAHNTVRVDGQDFSVCSDSWGYEKLAVPIKGEYKLTEKVDYLSGLHIGYLYLQDSVLAERRIIFMKPDIFLIFDQFYTNGEHIYEQNFHFGKGKLKKENNCCYIWQGEKASARLIAMEDGRDGALSRYPYSREYNLLEEGDKVTFTKSGSGFQSMVSLLAAGKAGKIPSVNARFVPIEMARSGQILSPVQAQAVEVIKDGEKYEVMVIFEEIVSEVDFFRVGKKEGYGKVIVFMPETEEGIVLSW